MKHLCIASIAATALVASAFTFPTTPPTGLLTGRVIFEPEPAADGTKVVFDGERPEAKPLNIEAEKSKGCGTVDTTDPVLLIGSSGGLANVVVTVEVAGAKVTAPEKPVALDQKTCRYEPHITVVPVGTTIEYANSDTVGHNVHIYTDKNEAFNQTIGAGSKEVRKYDKADRIEIKCDIHPWMNAWLVVSETPYYAVTDADGSFSIAGLPAGEHKAKLWHEKLGKSEATIKVGADGKCEALEVKLGLEKKSGRKR